ncbi:PA2778 family cysteine peptidase [Catenovulum sediminis]|uniref:PA2778 family cysteine peptidase n=1 Tax=Catenovulum sediminis TaxID=1740262 RepID=A0ABV1RJD3_9ALTE|nr:PA2778 family cysteine peptidase [Catenovulum sediminis]
MSLRCNAFVLLLGSLLFLSACSTTAPQTTALRNHPPISLNQQTHILDVPFFSQKDYYCGPTTLAEVFNYYGFNTTPEQIAPKVFVPSKNGSLQIEMVATIRQQNLLAYSDNGNLNQLLQLVHDGIPVIVLQNLSIEWKPLWHYAVVVGFDLKRQKVILHSGTNQAREVDMALFERTWQRSDFWFVAPLPLNKHSRALNKLTYVTAAQDFARIQKKELARRYFYQAIQYWPQYWIPYFLMANSYLANKQLEDALYWFKQGAQYGANESNYLNNYAYALNKYGCHKQAYKIIQMAIQLKQSNQQVLLTKQEIEENSSTQPHINSSAAYCNTL